jgi:sulfatase modifying factor 1
MRLAIVVLAACAGGCSLLVDLDGLSGGPRDGGGGQEGAGDDGGDARAPGDAAPDGTAATEDTAPRDASSDAPADAATGCPADKPGPALVPAGDFCIDATEVTNQQYQRFLDERAGDTGGQPSACGWNDSFTPSQSGLPWPPPPGRERYPVANVDWCDAHAFCAWAGKRLCGRIGGGPVGLDRAGDARESQWTSACSHAGTRTFCYGRSLDATACNDGKAESADQIVAAGSLATCQGGYDGIFDLGGNLEEWIDACDGATGANDRCAVAGGSAFSPPEDLACASSRYTEKRSDAYILRGFRCCSP